MIPLSQHIGGKSLMSESNYVSLGLWIVLDPQRKFQHFQIALQYKLL